MNERVEIKKIFKKKTLNENNNIHSRIEITTNWDCRLTDCFPMFGDHTKYKGYTICDKEYTL